MTLPSAPPPAATMGIFRQESDDGKEVVYEPVHKQSAMQTPAGEYYNTSAHKDNSQYNNTSYKDSPMYSTGAPAPMNTPAPHYDMPTEKPKQRICGIPKRIFIILLVVIAVVIALAAILGGVLGSRAHDNNNTTSAPTPSSNATTTTASAPEPSTSRVGSSIFGADNCPEDNNTDYESGTVTFRKLCSVDWIKGVTAISGSASDTVEDLGEIIAGSWEECMDYCVTYNRLRQGLFCQVAVYEPDITDSLQRSLGNCWLKNARGEANTPRSGVHAAYILDS